MRRSLGVRAWILAPSLAFVFACGPKEPPRQARLPDEPDPLADTAPSGNSASPSTASTNKSSGGAPLAPPPPGKMATSKHGEPPQVASLAAFMDGLRWGMSHAEVTNVFTQTGGLIWKDYDEKLAKARVGPEQTALEAEREQAKGAFKRSFIEFKDTPTGYDTTGMRGEFSYKNKESLMWVQRQGKKRYFFFINDRLWKMYDEIPFAEDGPMGKAYLDAVNILNAQLNAQGRVLSPDQSKGIFSTTVDWKDGQSHLRAVDRSNDKAVGIVVEDGSVLSNLAALRPNKMPDPNEIDPTVAAVTKKAPSDPNATDAPKKNPSAPPAKKKK